MCTFPAAEATDVRDGLFPQARQMLAVFQKNLSRERYCRSSKAIQLVTDLMPTLADSLYDVLLDMTWPRCVLPLIDGQGNVWFPPAAPEYTEIKFAPFFEQVMQGAPITDINQPLPMPIPYLLVTGSAGIDYHQTRIPSHNLGRVLDAAVALIRNPDIDTKGLLEYIKGPELIVGGTIINEDELCDIYEKGDGIIKIRTSTKQIEENALREVKEYCDWYGLKSRRCLLKKGRTIFVPYRAYLFDGVQCRLLSLKEILQAFIDHYRSWSMEKNDDALCAGLIRFKDAAMTNDSRSVKGLDGDVAECER